MCWLYVQIAVVLVVLSLQKIMPNYLALKDAGRKVSKTALVPASFHRLFD